MIKTRYHPYEEANSQAHRNREEAGTFQVLEVGDGIVKGHRVQLHYLCTKPGALYNTGAITANTATLPAGGGWVCCAPV